MTERETLAYSLGRDTQHCEAPRRMTVGERASYPSQRSQARLVAYRIERARRLRVGARTRKDTAQDGRR